MKTDGAEILMNAKLDLTSVQNWQNAKTQKLIKTKSVVVIHVNAKILLDMKWKVNHNLGSNFNFTVGILAMNVLLRNKLPS